MAGRGPRSRPARRRAHDDEPADGPVLEPELCTWGRHPVREALRGQRRVRAVHATSQAVHELGEVLSGVRVEECAPAALVKLAGDVVHQGVVAEVDPFPYVTADDLLASAAGPPVVLCLDQITDPHNLGAIARVCDASGATGLLLTEHRSAVVTGAVCKASAGAVEHVRIARCTNLAETIERLKDDTIWAYGASEHGERIHTEVDFAGGVLLVLGSEGAGIRPRVASMCDELVRVPMRGKVSSLNVATVAALLSYEVVRQHAAAGSS